MFILALLACSAIWLQLTFEQVTQQVQELFPIDLGQICPQTAGWPGIGRGGTWLVVRLNMGHHLPLAVKLGLAVGAQPS